MYYDRSSSILIPLVWWHHP